MCGGFSLSLFPSSSGQDLLPDGNFSRSSLFCEPEMVYWHGAGLPLPWRPSCPCRICGWSPWHMLGSGFHLPWGSKAEFSTLLMQWMLGHIFWAGQMLESEIIFAFVAPHFPALMWMTHSYRDSFKQILFDFLAPANMCLWTEVLLWL